jgi:hypothetical protein
MIGNGAEIRHAWPQDRWRPAVEQHAILDRKIRRLLFRVLPGQTAIDEVRGARDVIGIA